MSNHVGDCFKFLWPFQDVRTFKTHSTCTPKKDVYIFSIFKQILLGLGTKSEISSIVISYFMLDLVKKDDFQYRKKNQFYVVGMHIDYNIQPAQPS